MKIKKDTKPGQENIYDIYLSTESSTENWTQWTAYLGALFPQIIYVNCNIT